MVHKEADMGGPSPMATDDPPKLEPAQPLPANDTPGPPSKKPKCENPQFLKTGDESIASGGRPQGTPRTPRIAREVSPSNALLNMSARQLAKKEQEAQKEEERRKRAENEELMKAQRKAARASQVKDEETRSPEELYSQVVWAKLGKFHWWPSQIVDPTTVVPPEGEHPDKVLARFFGSYDYAWVERRKHVSPFDHKQNERKKLTKKKAFLIAIEEVRNDGVENVFLGLTPGVQKLSRAKLRVDLQSSKAENCIVTGALPEAWTRPVEEEPQPEAKEKTGKKEKQPAANGHADEVPSIEATAAKERIRKGKAPLVESKSTANRRARQLRIMRHLGLAPPEGSPFTHEALTMSVA